MATKEKTEYTAPQAETGPLDYEIQTSGPTRKVLDGMLSHAQAATEQGNVSWLKQVESTTKDAADPNSADGIFEGFHYELMLEAAHQHVRRNALLTGSRRVSNEALEAGKVMGLPVRDRLESSGAEDWRPKGGGVADTPATLERAVSRLEHDLGAALHQSDRLDFRAQAADLGKLDHALASLEWDERAPTLRELVEAAAPELAERLFSDSDRREDWAKGFSDFEVQVMAAATGEISTNWSKAAGEKAGEELGFALTQALSADCAAYMYKWLDENDGSWQTITHDQGGWPDDRENLHRGILKAMQDSCEAALGSMLNGDLANRPEEALKTYAAAQAAVSELSAMTEAGQITPVGDEHDTDRFSLSGAVNVLLHRQNTRNLRLQERTESAGEALNTVPLDAEEHATERVEHSTVGASDFGLMENGPMLQDMVQQSLEANPGHPETHFRELMEGISEDDWFRLDKVLQEVAKSGIAAEEFAAVEAAGPVHTTSGSDEALFLAAQILAERWHQHVERTAPEG